MIERIERAEKACTEGKQREYNEFLKTVIQKIVVYSRRFAEGETYPHNRKHKLLGVTIVPVNPSAIPFENRNQVMDALYDEIGVVPCLRYEVMPGAHLTVATDDATMEQFEAISDPGFRDRFPRHGGIN